MFFVVARVFFAGAFAVVLARLPGVFFAPSAGASAAFARDVVRRVVLRVVLVVFAVLAVLAGASSEVLEVSTPFRAADSVPLLALRRVVVLCSPF